MIAVHKSTVATVCWFEDPGRTVFSSHRTPQRHPHKLECYRRMMTEMLQDQWVKASSRSWTGIECYEPRVKTCRHT